MTSRGFTLIEIIVAITIMILIMGIAMFQLANTIERNLQADVDRMSSNIRYLRDKAITTGALIRVVINIDERSYKFEVSSDDALIDVKPSSDIGKDDKNAEHTGKESLAQKTKLTEDEIKEKNLMELGKEKDKDEEIKTLEESMNKIELVEKKQAVFSGLEDDLVKMEVKLKDGVVIKDVQTDINKDVQTTGIVYIHIFSDGTLEKAVVNFSDEDDNIHYSLRTVSMTGEVKELDDYGKLEE